MRNAGDWEGWLRFFLRGVYAVSTASTTTARAILDMREKHRAHIAEQLPNSSKGLKLLDHLFQRPIVSVREAEQAMEVSYVTASNVIGTMEQAGILREITGQKRNKIYSYEPYINLFNRQTLELPPPDAVASDDRPHSRSTLDYQQE